MLRKSTSSAMYCGTVSNSSLATSILMSDCQAFCQNAVGVLCLRQQRCSRHLTSCAEATDENCHHHESLYAAVLLEGEADAQLVIKPMPKQLRYTPLLPAAVVRLLTLSFAIAPCMQYSQSRGSSLQPAHARALATSISAAGRVVCLLGAGAVELAGAQGRAGGPHNVWACATELPSPAQQAAFCWRCQGEQALPSAPSVWRILLLHLRAIVLSHPLPRRAGKMMHKTAACAFQRMLLHSKVQKCTDFVDCVLSFQVSLVRPPRYQYRHASKWPSPLHEQRCQEANDNQI